MNRLGPYDDYTDGPAMAKDLRSIFWNPTGDFAFDEVDDDRDVTNPTAAKLIQIAELSLETIQSSAARKDLFVRIADAVRLLGSYFDDERQAGEDAARKIIHGRYQHAESRSKATKAPKPKRKKSAITTKKPKPKKKPAPKKQ